MTVTTSDHPFLDYAPLTQTKDWEVFQRSLSKNTINLSGSGWSCLLIEQSTPFGKYWLAPYGPFLSVSIALPYALEQIRTHAEKANISWVVMEPYSRNLSFNPLDHNLRLAYKSYNPSHTLVCDLTLSQGELKQKLSSTYRNLVKRSQGGPLKFVTSTDPEQMHIFSTMQAGVEQKNNVRLHSSSYLAKQAQILMPRGKMKLEVANLDGEPIASAIILDTDNTASYAYAASTTESRKHEAGTLLLWQAILNSKAEGKLYFDMFGAAPPDAGSGHPWAGFTAFKRKFGGEYVAYAGTWELPINQLRYNAYRASLPLVRKLQKIKR